MLNRRQFLLGVGGAAALASLPLVINRQSQQWLVSAFDQNKQHFAGAFDLAGKLISAVPLPARGHGSAAHPTKAGHAIMFARRPGTFLMEVDFATGQITQRIDSGSDHHFFGHGVFSRDGKQLFSVENNFAAGHGEIVVRDSDNYQVLERYHCGGVGPHECRLMPDGNTLVIANGGIKTHPEWPRKKLNLDTMSPALTYMDLKSGKIIDQYRLANHQLSIRHLDVSDSGKVFAGLQYQGPKSNDVPLAISHHGQDSLQFLQADDVVWRSLNHYTASVCVDSSAQQVAISCPRGDVITLWELNSDQYIRSIKMRDVAGLGLANSQVVATNGKGQVLNLNQAKQQFLKFNDIRWDNHLTTIQS
ncbi:MAG: DUF1513 domain-containing protein [Psychrobium sp.]